MKKSILLLILLYTSFLFAQEKRTKEFSIQNDNDLYTSLTRDRYYTNGTFLSFRYLPKNKQTETIKKIYEIGLGQQIYTPQNASVALKREHDRPFAGYLFAKFGISNFYKNNTILKLNAQIGVIGSNSFAEETLNFVHNLWKLKTSNGWKYQISNAFALDLKASYIKNIPNLSSSIIAIDLITTLNAGTVFTNIGTTANLRIGLTPLKDINNSIAYNGNLTNHKTNPKELFLYIKPTINYILYDATIQGSFLNETSPITFEIKPITFSSEFGIAYALNKINIGYNYTIHTKKLKSNGVPNTNSYGSIFINYLLN